MSQRAIYPDGISASDIPLKLSPGIISNGHLFLTGITGSSPEGHMPDEPVAQFRAAFDKIAGLLAVADLDFGAVVDMTSYHIDIARHFDAFAAVHDEYVRPPFPAWTAIEAAGLRRRGALVEIRVTARVD